MASGVRNLFKLYVANIPWTVGHNELRQYFSKFGPINTAAVIFNRNTGLSRNYGFVFYSNREGFDNALKTSGHKLEGNTLRVEPASAAAENN